AAPAPSIPAPRVEHAVRAPAPQAPQYRPAAGHLDPQGRALPPRMMEDDQLEIPAFLRRQAN
ncbi:MAG: cell division protein FtsZ, partial [Methylorubrum rhodinum]